MPQLAKEQKIRLKTVFEIYGISTNEQIQNSQESSNVRKERMIKKIYSVK